MRAVAISVLEGHVGIGVVAEMAATLKGLVLGVETGVDDVGPGTLAGRSVVDVGAVVGSAVGDAAETPWSVELAGEGVELPHSDGLNGKDLKRRVINIRNLLFSYQGRNKTHLVAGLNLLNSSSIKLARVSLEALTPHLFNSGGDLTVTAAKASTVDVLHPGEMVVNLWLDEVVFKSDDVLVREHLGAHTAGTRCRGGESSGEESSEEEGEGLEVHHFEKDDSR